MNLKIALLSGDGIGPEVIKQSQKIVDAIAKKYNHSIEYTSALVGAIAIDNTGNPLPEETIEICEKSDAVLFGAIGDTKYDNNPNAKVRPEQGLLKLRKELGLFANIRPIKAYDKLMKQSPLKEDRIIGTDLVFYRELTGGIYFGEKKLSADGKVASDFCQYTKEEIERIANLAFKAARKRRKKLTLVDKANVLATSRLWRKTILEITEKYKDIEVDFLFVDNAAMQLILNPKQFDVILTENLFGDILSDAGSVIAGSIGLLASASIGSQTALFEPIHGSFPQAAGKNIANPIASILSAAMLLEYFNLNQEADLIKKAVENAIEKNKTTSDINTKNYLGTEEVGNFICEFINKY